MRLPGPRGQRVATPRRRWSTCPVEPVAVATRRLDRRRAPRTTLFPRVPTSPTAAAVGGAPALRGDRLAPRLMAHRDSFRLLAGRPGRCADNTRSGTDSDREPRRSVRRRDRGGAPVGLPPAAP